MRAAIRQIHAHAVSSDSIDPAATDTVWRVLVCVRTGLSTSDLNKSGHELTHIRDESDNGCVLKRDPSRLQVLHGVLKEFVLSWIRK